MAWTNPSHILRLVVNGADSGQAINNIFHFKMFPDAESTPVSLASVLAAFHLRWVALVIPNAPITYAVKGYTAALITGSELVNTPPAPPPPPPALPNKLTWGEQNALIPMTDNVGTKIGGPLPTFNAMAVRWITAIRARYYRGGSRLRLGVEEDTDNNEWNVGFGETYSDVNAALPAFYADYAPGGDWGAVIVRLSIFAGTTFLRQPAGTTTPAELTQPVIAHVLNPRVSSQVSRKDRGRLA